MTTATMEMDWRNKTEFERRRLLPDPGSVPTGLRIRLSVQNGQPIDSVARYLAAHYSHASIEVLCSDLETLKLWFEFFNLKPRPGMA